MKPAQRISFCGVMCALSTMILIASVFPYATYAISALAGIVFISVALELGMRYGIFCFVVTALLSFLVTPDPEAKMLFVCFFGYYPLIHLRLIVWHNRTAAWIIKLIVFNIAVLSAFAVLQYVLGFPFESMQIGGVDLTWVLLPFANIVFVIYDIALDRVTAFYRVRLHPLIKKLFRS